MLSSNKVLFTGVFILFLCVSGLFAQKVQLDYDRIEAASYNRMTILGITPSTPGEAVRWIDGKTIDSLMSKENLGYSESEFFQRHYQFYGNKNTGTFPSEVSQNRKGLLKKIYRSDEFLFEQYNSKYYFQFNPLLGLKVMKSKDDNYTINARGLEFRAGLGKRVHISSKILEIQRSFPQRIDDFIKENRAVPGVIFFKNFGSDLFSIENGYDYNIAEAKIMVEAADFLDVELGHGRNFIGSGYRSLILSDQVAPYFYLKLNTHIGNLHYQNIFAEINAESNVERGGDQLLTKKYFVNHYLGYSILKNLEVGISETIIFSRANNFELQYLNPVIFYRSVEQALGSRDNIILAANGKWDIKKKVRLYGQFSFDEFIFNELFIERRGWWGNKWALQLGAQVADPLGVKESLLRVEYNIIRPYTYQHRDSISNYTHARQSLAHPAGSNLTELLVEYDWRMNKNWNLRLMASWIKQGIDYNSEDNYGSNVNNSFRNRTGTYGIELLQGLESDRKTINLSLSRELWKNIELEANIRMFRSTFEEDNSLDSDYLYYGLGLHWNFRTTDIIL